MNSITYQTQLSQVGNDLNQVLRREGVHTHDDLGLNAKIKRTYPKEG
jgi:hypothetical protein